MHDSVTLSDGDRRAVFPDWTPPNPHRGASTPGRANNVSLTILQRTHFPFSAKMGFDGQNY
jgi:hypothetical protein